MKKRIISLLLAVIMYISLLPASVLAVSLPFTDVKSSDWYYSAVTYAYENGLFYGTTDTTFSPDISMTRGMFVTVLGHKAGVEASQYSGSKFSDVYASDYYAPYVKWASENGIVYGTGNNQFSPNAEITREQIAKILYDYLAALGKDMSAEQSRYYTFSDYSDTSGYAVNAMIWATEVGVFNGDNGFLFPRGTATRAQVAAIFMNAQDLFKTDSSVITPEQTRTDWDDYTVYETFRTTYDPQQNGIIYLSYKDR